MQNRVIVAIDAFDRGTITRQQICHWFAPSIKAASSSSFGRLRKKFIIMITYVTGTAPGIIRDQKELISQVFLTTM